MSYVKNEKLERDITWGKLPVPVSATGVRVRASVNDSIQSDNNSIDAITISRGI